MYKTKLQELCHQRRWGLPRYSAVKDGPDHMPSFMASVYVNGVTFTSPGAFSSSKEAHNQAAMLAFQTFSSASPGSSTPTPEYDSKEEVGAMKPQDRPIPAHSSAVTDGKKFGFTDFVHAGECGNKPLSQGDSGPFKSLLLELTQREGFCIPTYKTTQVGSPHMPTFFSTVEVEGEEFHGKASKSKKEAEQDAAKIAYIALKECGLNMYAAFYSSLGENKPTESINRSDIFKSKQNLNPEDKMLPAHVKVKNEVNNPSFPQPLDLSCLPISESNKAKTPKTSSYLLCNRFKVYTSLPNIAFSEGITVLPIGDNKWVAVSLEFPNDKDL